MRTSGSSATNLDVPASLEGGGGPPVHARPVDEVTAALGVDAAGGLDPEEASRRLRDFGPNRLDTGAGRSRFRILLAQFADVLVWVLIVAALVSGLMLGDVVDAAVILAIVLLNTTIGFTQESRAETALASLRELAAPTATVVRASHRVEVAAVELVPGDVVVLESGDRLPADCRLIEVVRLMTDEAPLTGESLPVHKTASPVAADAELGDRRSMVYAGTVVSAGRGTGVVVATGRSTEMGRIAELLEEPEPPSPLQVALARIGRRVAMLAGVAALVVFALGMGAGGELESVILVAVALAVAAIPEGLPAVTTITLAGGVRAMAEGQAIVRRLPAVEALGAAQVICTDKTGTLTRNRMRVGETEVEVGAPAVGPLSGIRGLATVVTLCSDIVREDSGFLGDPTEVALVEAVSPEIVDFEGLRSAYPRIDELAFESDRKRMSTLHRWNDRYLLAVKGAPESILECSTQVDSPDGPAELSGGDVEARLERAARLGSRGLRTIAAGYRLFDEPPTDLAVAESDLVFLGMMGMSDEPRPEAGPAVRVAQGAGIEVVMVTGDHQVTATAVAEELELLGDRQAISGRATRRMGALELSEQIDQIGVFARVDPADKVTIVQAWQAQGSIVAMTGDGINDAPALRMADIGVAMGSGTDVAKEAADIVLADDNFATIITAVERGRTIFANLKKVVYFLLSANVSEIFVMLGGFLFFGRVGQPLLAVQLLWINLITDGLPALALGVDPPAAEVMRRPPDSKRDILGLPHQLRLGWQAAILAIAPLAMLTLGERVGGLDWEQTRTLAFTSLVMVQLLHALAVRAQTKTVWRTALAGNRMLVVSIIASVLLQVAVVFTPVGQSLFDTVPAPGPWWMVMAAVSAVPFVIIDVIKVALRRLRPYASTAVD